MKEVHEFRIVITPFCNYRCPFCHSEGFIEEFTPLLLSPQDYGFITKAAKELWGWNSATITGGEPLISPIYREVCEIIANEGIGITTVTNASLISSPRKLLIHNDQVNISIHTMDPKAYRKITGSSYPLGQVIDTIITIRSYFPEMVIHLNSTVIRGINDNLRDMNALIKFANEIGGEAKFIDLASNKQELIVSCNEIETNLTSLGFNKTDEGVWQTIFMRDSERAIVTRCGFSQQNTGCGYRNLFLNPDGTITADDRRDLSINLLREIHEQNIEGFAKKIEWYFPPAKRI